MKRSDFLNEVAGYAVADYKRSKILPSLTIAQAILESGWGQSGLTQRSNNLFGIKAGKAWTGEVDIANTREVYNGKEVYVDAPFRKYPSFEGSVRDHNDLLSNPRYKKVKGETDYKTAFHEIKNAGYATNPKYPTLLISLIEKFELYKYDMEVLKMLKVADANKIIKVLQQEWAKANDADKQLYHYLCEEVRRVSGQKKSS